MWRFCFKLAQHARSISQLKRQLNIFCCRSSQSRGNSKKRTKILKIETVYLTFISLASMLMHAYYKKPPISVNFNFNKFTSHDLPRKGLSRTGKTLPRPTTGPTHRYKNRKRSPFFLAVVSFHFTASPPYS